MVALTNEKPAIVRLGDAVLGADNSERLKTDMLLLRTYPLLAKVVLRYRLNEDPAFLQADEPRTVMEAARAIMARFRGSVGQEGASGQPKFDLPPPQIDSHLSSEDIERLTPYVAKLESSLYVSKIEETH